MAFTGVLQVFHGTIDQYAWKIATPAAKRPHSINLSLCRPLTDFGRGFYVTTSQHQALQWAQQLSRRLARTIVGGGSVPRLVRFDVDLNLLKTLDMLAFVWEGPPVATPFWDFVTDCRGGTPPRASFDVIMGPVTLWPQTLTLSNCDQICFRTPRSLDRLENPFVI